MSPARSGDSSFWEWSDDELRHPEGRALGGEPCVQCGEPVPPGAHWKHRDRHVCSPRCNANLRRKLNRRVRSGAHEPPAPEPPHLRRGGIVFGTDPAAAFPYEFLGWAPLVGDAVERHGSITVYVPLEPLDFEGEQHLVAGCTHLNTGAAAIVGIEADGRVGGIWWWRADGSGETLEHHEHFDSDGQRWVWATETFRDVDADGATYSWSAPVCVLADHATDGALWTPAYQERSERLRRTSDSTARHARRQRMVGPAGTVERIDPLEVYVADGWVCQLCGEPVDPELRHPDKGSASIDHKLPLAAGGLHERANVWTAHLVCNIRKGARVT